MIHDPQNGFITLLFIAVNEYEFVNELDIINPSTLLLKRKFIKYTSFLCK